MQEIKNHPRATLNVFPLLVVVAVLLVSGCGSKFPGDKTSPGGDSATTPSPTEETVIRGHA